MNPTKCPRDWTKTPHDSWAPTLGETGRCDWVHWVSPLGHPESWVRRSWTRTGPSWTQQPTLRVGETTPKPRTGSGTGPLEKRHGRLQAGDGSPSFYSLKEASCFGCNRLDLVSSEIGQTRGLVRGRMAWQKHAKTLRETSTAQRSFGSLVPGSQSDACSYQRSPAPYHSTSP